MLGSLVLLAVGPVPADQPARRDRPARPLVVDGRSPAWASARRSPSSPWSSRTRCPRADRRGDGSLTFFQQIGGTVGLTFAGTVFASRLVDRDPEPARRRGRAAAGRDRLRRRQQRRPHRRPATSASGSWPACRRRRRPQIAPLIPAIVAGHPRGVLDRDRVDVLGRHGGARSSAARVALFLREEPMRATFDFEATPADGAATGG